MDFSAYKTLAFERAGKVLNVTFNRPDMLNALDDDMQADLVRLFDEIATDAATHVAVLTGAGRVFCAGGDMDKLQELVDHPERFLPALHDGKKLIFSMLDCPKPIIAKVNGHAIGAGASIALFADVIFAAEHARIGDPHTKVGLVAGDGGAAIWPQLIGYARAKEYLMTGEPLLATDAARIGLINHAVPAADLDRVVDEFAQKLANGASKAIQWTKVSINVGLKQLAHPVMDASIAYEVLSASTRDHAEAVDAFRHKRTPSFTGE